MKKKLCISILLCLAFAMLLSGCGHRRPRGYNPSASEEASSVSIQEEQEPSVTEDEPSDIEDSDIESVLEEPSVEESAEEASASEDTEDSEDPDAESSEEESEVLYVEPEWPELTADAFTCNSISYTDKNGYMLCVGAEGAAVSGTQGGLVLNPMYSAASVDHPIGYRVTTDFGEIAARKDGSFRVLDNTCYTLVKERVVLDGKSNVMIGRTFDQQYDCNYYNEQDFGVCWYINPMVPDVPSEVHLRLYMYDLNSASITGIYTVTIVRIEDGTFTFKTIEPYSDPLLTTERSSLVKTAAADLINSASIPNLTGALSVDPEYDALAEVVTTSKWAEYLTTDGETNGRSNMRNTGTLVAVTVNTMVRENGPITLYYSYTQEVPEDVAETAKSDSDEKLDGFVSEVFGGFANTETTDAAGTEEPDTSTEVKVPGAVAANDNGDVFTFIGYDWVGESSWDRMVGLNGMGSGNDFGGMTIRTYKPLEPSPTSSDGDSDSEEAEIEEAADSSDE